MHNGHIIKELITEKNIAITTFSDLMQMTRQNMYAMLARSDWKLSELLKACKLLEEKLEIFIDPEEKKYLCNNKYTQNLQITGNENAVSESNQIYESFKTKNKVLELEIKNLKLRLKDKEELIELLKNK